MSYGHADKIAATAAGTPAAGTPAAGTPPIDPALYRREDLRRILADRDITALYHALKDAGLTQRRIAELTGQSQSEVSEILNGRRVRDVTVLERICDGLGIPPELMGLSYGGHGAYGGQGTVVSTEEVIEMLRRHLIALGGASQWAPRPRSWASY